MRAFIAIELPGEIQEALAEFQRELKRSQPGIKLVAPENIHLTLKFLGDIQESKISPVAQILQDTAANNSSFTLSIGSLGAFPEKATPRVIWAGVGNGDDRVKNLAVMLEEKLATMGIEKEKRPFSSHITIARAGYLQDRMKFAQTLKGISDRLPKDNLQFRAEKITLFKSILTPSGAIYEVQKTASLKAA